MSKIIEFFGKECPHCHKMQPHIDKLAEEEGVVIEQLEVWHSDENAALMQPWTQKSMCMGVPMFVNTESGEVICGSTDYDSLKKFVGK